ncbi:MAG: hypothetical protein KAG06_08680 [Methylococcales bacterium]|nr:hypothetical protein [Methylococcales bacterium]
MLLSTIQKTLLTRSNSRLLQTDISDNSKSRHHSSHYDTVFAYVKRKKNQHVKRKPSQPSSVYFECNKVIPSEELLSMLDKIITIL